MASGMTVLKALEYAAKELRDELPLDCDVDEAAALLDRLREIMQRYKVELWNDTAFGCECARCALAALLRDTGETE